MTQTVHSFFNLGKLKCYMGGIDMGVGLSKARVEVEKSNDDTVTEDGGTGSSVSMIQSNRKRLQYTFHFLSNSPSLMAIIKLCNQDQFGHFQGILDMGNGTKYILNNMVIQNGAYMNMLQFTDEVNEVDVVVTIQSAVMDSVQSIIDQGLETGVELAEDFLSRIN